MSRQRVYYPGLLLPVPRDMLLLTNIELHIVSIFKNYFICSVVARVKIVCFKTIVPNLEVLYDALAFIACQKFTGLFYNHKGSIAIFSILIFVDVNSSQIVSFNNKIRQLFFCF